MKIEALLSIVGFFGVVGLSINAFFLRGILQDLNDVKIKLAIMSGRDAGTEKRISDLEGETKESRERLHALGNLLNGFLRYERNKAHL